MAGMCKVTIIGNLGRDPEKRYSQDGKPVTRFSVAATTRTRDKEGEWGDHTEWFNVTVFGTQAETLSERLTKGSKVYVDGRFESRQYESNGKQGHSLDVFASTVMMLDSRKTETTDEEATTTTVAPRTRGPKEDAGDLDDMPF